MLLAQNRATAVPSRTPGHGSRGSARAKLTGETTDSDQHLQDRDTEERWARAEGASLETEAERARQKLMDVQRKSLQPIDFGTLERFTRWRSWGARFPGASGGFSPFYRSGSLIPVGYASHRPLIDERRFWQPGRSQLRRQLTRATPPSALPVTLDFSDHAASPTSITGVHITGVHSAPHPRLAGSRTRLSYTCSYTWGPSSA